MQPVRSVPCPRCGAPALFTPDNKWRPFCSERCKMIDLGLWGSDAYRVPAEEPPEDPPVEPEGLPPVEPEGLPPVEPEGLPPVEPGG